MTFVWASLDDFALQEPSMGAVVEADAAARPPTAPATQTVADAWGKAVDWIATVETTA